MRKSSELFLCTTIARDREEYDVCVYYKVDSYSPGCAARIRYDANDHPAEAPEYEFSFVRAEFDGGPDAPLTEPEIKSLEVWFEAHHAEACETASECADREAA